MFWSYSASQIIGANNVYPSYGTNSKAYGPKNCNTYDYIVVVWEYFVGKIKLLRGV